MANEEAKLVPVPKPPKNEDPSPALVEKEVKKEETLPPPPPAPIPAGPIDPTAVETTESGLKYGWQQEPTRPEKDTAPCMHTGIFQARQQVASHALGHEWVCSCGTTFEVVLNSGAKKTLKEKLTTIEE